MRYAPRSRDWCFRCSRDADDGVRLFTTYIARPFVAVSGKRTTRTVGIRLCGDCARVAIEAYARSSRRQPVDLLERSTIRPRVRTARGTYASRAAIANASFVAAADR